MKLTLSSFKFNFVTHMIPTYHGHMDLDMDIINLQVFRRIMVAYFQTLLLFTIDSYMVNWKLLLGVYNTRIFCKTPRNYLWVIHYNSW